MKRLKYILSLLLFVCCLPIMAQSDIEVTDSISTEWEDSIGGGFNPSIPYYDLIYMLDGVEYKRMSVAVGSTIKPLDVPAREGHTFSGWIGLPDAMPAKDVTVTGSFTVNKYQLTYIVDGEVYRTDSIAYGTELAAIDVPAREGHTFSGWIGLPDAMPAKDVTVTGSFTVNKYLVTFKVGDEVIAADTLEYGTTIYVPEAPEKEGYSFDGWGEVAETVPAGDVTYEGTYTVNIYKVYYYVDDELVHTDEVAYGEVIPEYVYEQISESDVFLGWIGETYDTMPAHDVTYIANIDSGIKNLTKWEGGLSIYDIWGRSVKSTKKLKRGVYIINGRKVVIK